MGLWFPSTSQANPIISCPQKHQQAEACRKSFASSLHQLPQLIFSTTCTRTGDAPMQRARTAFSKYTIFVVHELNLVWEITSSEIRPKGNLFFFLRFFVVVILRRNGKYSDHPVRYDTGETQLGGKGERLNSRQKQTQHHAGGRLRRDAQYYPADNPPRSSSKAPLCNQLYRAKTKRCLQLSPL